MSDVQSGLRLDELLGEVQQRLAEVVATRGRMQGLLDAVLAVADGLELDTTLRRIVQAAVNLVDARFGALGVLAPDGSISRFIYVGLDEATRARMGALPEGKGLLGPAHPRWATAAAVRSGRARGVGRLPSAPSADAHLPRGAGPGP